MAESTTEKKIKCAYCGDEITEDPIRKAGKVFCCEACAFQGSRPKGCDGREPF